MLYQVAGSRTEILIEDETKNVVSINTPRQVIKIQDKDKKLIEEIVKGHILLCHCDIMITENNLTVLQITPKGTTSSRVFKISILK